MIKKCDYIKSENFLFEGVATIKLISYFISHLTYLQKYSS